MAGENHITKQDALKFMKEKNKHKKSIIDMIINTTLFGEEYQDLGDGYNFDMSYYCRAFNITEDGVSRQKNRIKNRYKKHKNKEGIEEYYRSLLNKAWPGYQKEFPRMDDLLDKFPDIEEEEKETAKIGKPIVFESSFSEEANRQIGLDKKKIIMIIGVLLLILYLSREIIYQLLPMVIGIFVFYLFLKAILGKKEKMQGAKNQNSRGKSWYLDLRLPNIIISAFLLFEGVFGGIFGAMSQGIDSIWAYVPGIIIIIAGIGIVVKRSSGLFKWGNILAAGLLLFIGASGLLGGIADSVESSVIAVMMIIMGIYLVVNRN